MSEQSRYETSLWMIPRYMTPLLVVNHLSVINGTYMGLLKHILKVTPQYTSLHFMTCHYMLSHYDPVINMNFYLP